jgi:hypothetical protein
MKACKKLTINWESEDGIGFKAYIKSHYIQAIKLCEEIIKSDYRYEKYSLMLFDKLATPLVYLYEQWLSLPIEEKAKYNPKLKEIKAKAEEMAKQAFSQFI